MSYALTAHKKSCISNPQRFFFGSGAGLPGLICGKIGWLTKAKNMDCGRSVLPDAYPPVLLKLLHTLSLHFNGRFPGEPGLAGVY